MPPFEIHVFSPFSTIGVAVQRASHCIAATSEPASGSDNANAAIATPAGHSRQIPLLLRFAAPNSVIAPEPSPCIANAKSASPECHASVSRIMHSARVSIASAAAARTRAADGVLQPAGLAQLANQFPARAIDILRHGSVCTCARAHISDSAASSFGAAARKTANRDSFVSGQFQSPLNTGFCFATNA